MGAIFVPMDALTTWRIFVFMKLKLLCFRMKSRIIETMWGGRKFMGRRGFYSYMK